MSIYQGSEHHPKVLQETMQLKDIPDELLLEIFSRLPVNDLVTCALYVCKDWKVLCKSTSLWKGRDYRIEERQKEHEIVPLAQLIPHLTTVRVGRCSTFKVWFSGCNVFLSLGVSIKTIRKILSSSNINSIIVPRRLFDSQWFPKLFNSDKRLNCLTVNHDPSMINIPEISLPLLLRQGSLSELRVLWIGASEHITTDTILQLCQQCPHLEELSLCFYSQVSDHILQNLQMCPKLHLLDISTCTSLDDLSFLQYCLNLKELDLSSCHSLPSASFQHLLHLKKLRRFRMGNCRVDALPLVLMGECLKDLEIIELFYSFDYNYDQIEELRNIAPHIIVLTGPCHTF